LIYLTNTFVNEIIEMQDRLKTTMPNKIPPSMLLKECIKIVCIKRPIKNPRLIGMDTTKSITNDSTHQASCCVSHHALDLNTPLFAFSGDFVRD